jgi:Kef-type K+ transport system membrane component KefB
MYFAVKPMLERTLAGVLRSNGDLGRGTIVGILVVVFSAALFTEVIGIHALFGAFLVGVVMPRDPQFHSRLKERLENFSSAFLLPLFFAFTGLRTQIGLLGDWNGWMVCAGLIAVATVGKLGGAMVTARWTGLSWNDSFALGALMNTRGLVELIVLNVGFDLGILSARVFAMTVIMALVTTFMTGPLLSLAAALRRKSPTVVTPQARVY